MNKMETEKSKFAKLQGLLNSSDVNHYERYSSNIDATRRTIYIDVEKSWN